MSFYNIKKIIILILICLFLYYFLPNSLFCLDVKEENILDLKKTIPKISQELFNEYNQYPFMNCFESRAHVLNEDLSILNRWCLRCKKHYAIFSDECPICIKEDTSIHLPAFILFLLSFISSIEIEETYEIIDNSENIE